LRLAHKTKCCEEGDCDQILLEHDISDEALCNCRGQIHTSKKRARQFKSLNKIRFFVFPPPLDSFKGFDVKKIDKLRSALRARQILLGATPPTPLTATRRN
jgi:hypothetical protein